MADDPQYMPEVGEGQDAQGVDLTLIDWMLSLTPRERLMWAQRQANAIRRMRHAAGLPVDPYDAPTASGEVCAGGGDERGGAGQPARDV
jgi:hypothetical protein